MLQFNIYQAKGSERYKQANCHRNYQKGKQAVAISLYNRQQTWLQLCVRLDEIRTADFILCPTISRFFAKGRKRVGNVHAICYGEANSTKQYPKHA